MNSRIKLFGLLGFLALVLTVSVSAQQAGGQNIAGMKFATFPGLPTCALGAVQSGNPATGPSIIAAKLSAGCVIPWHWHTPVESLMIVSGTARMEMKDAKSMTFKAGGFAQVPSNHAHQFRCTTPCTFFVHSDTAFDIHYVNAAGTEIPPADALKAVKEKPGK